MSVNYRFIEAAPERVFDVLADGWLFAGWVVGASRIRDVGEGWPRRGTDIHHSFGLWPAVLDDRTTALEWDPPRRLVLKARGRPLGATQVTIEARPRPGGCVVRMTEDALGGLARFLPRSLLDAALHVRNAETLRRLAYLAEGGAGAHGRPSPHT